MPWPVPAGAGDVCMQAPFSAATRFLRLSFLHSFPLTREAHASQDPIFCSNVSVHFGIWRYMSPGGPSPASLLHEQTGQVLESAGPLPGRLSPFVEQGCLPLWIWGLSPTWQSPEMCSVLLIQFNFVCMAHTSWLPRRGERTRWKCPSCGFSGWNSGP